MKVGLVCGLWSNRLSMQVLHDFLAGVRLEPIWLDYERTPGLTVSDYISQVIRKVIGSDIRCLCGHSAGALICAKIAEYYPNGINRLVLFAPASPRGIFPVSNRHQFNGLIRTFPRLLCSTFKLSEKVAEMMLYNQYRFLGKEWEYQDRVELESTRAFWSIMFPGVALKPIRVPSLVVSGLKDRLTPPAAVQKFAVRFLGKAKATVVLMANHDHCSIVENPEAVQRAINFIQEA